MSRPVLAALLLLWSPAFAPAQEGEPKPATVQQDPDAAYKELAKGLNKAIELIRSLREEFWRNVRVLGSADTLNQSLEKAGRVADFLELGELMCIDALHRRESCGGHFRAESQTEDGEALRHDDEYLYVAAWEFSGGADGADGSFGVMGPPVLHKEDLVYEAIELKQRSYK